MWQELGMVATRGSEDDTEGAQAPPGYTRPVCHLPYRCQECLTPVRKPALTAVGITERPEF